MSAYIVSPDTINLIATAADWFCKGSSFYMDPTARDGEGRDRLSPHTDTAKMAEMMWNENVHSVNSRYNLTEAHPFKYQRVDIDRAAVAIDPAILVLGSIRCLRYQSCEASDYAETNAHKLLNWIESACINRLVSVADAPWGWTADWSNTRREESRAKINAQFSGVTH